MTTWTNGRVAFPLDKGDDPIELAASTHNDRARFDHSLQNGGFLFGANGIQPRERETLCQKLVRLVPGGQPYVMDFTPMDRCNGRSYELAAFILHARTQAAPRAWPTVCATGQLTEQGGVEPIEGFKHKLQLTLALDPPPAWFVHPAGQTLGAAEEALLRQLAQRNIQVLAIGHIDQLPAELVGDAPSRRNAPPDAPKRAGATEGTRPTPIAGSPSPC